MSPYRRMQGVFHFFVSLPIWFYLLHTLLSASHVDRLVWFLFWIYVPVGFVTAIFGAAADSEDRKAKK